MALSTFSPFAVKEISSFKWLTEMVLEFLDSVFQVLPIELVFFVVVLWVNVGSEDIVIVPPKGVKLPQSIF